MCLLDMIIIDTAHSHCFGHRWTPMAPPGPMHRLDPTLLSSPMPTTTQHSSCRHTGSLGTRQWCDDDHNDQYAITHTATWACLKRSGASTLAHCLHTAATRCWSTARSHKIQRSKPLLMSSPHLCTKHTRGLLVRVNNDQCTASYTHHAH